MNAMQLHSRFATAVALAFALSALPAYAAVSAVTPSSFLVTHRVETAAPPAALFEAIAQPGRWWSATHTWSGSAENLRMRLGPGGCFCEIWDKNFVEHARVIASTPGKSLRLEGGLGPLQEMAVNAVLDFVIAPRAGGSALVVTYRVRGTPDAALDKLAPAVDKVLGEQVQRLAAYVDAQPGNAKPASVEERFIDAGGTRLRYLETGRGEPVILLHDAGATSEKQWVDTGHMRAIADNFRAIALDVREPEDVVRAMDALGIAKVHLVGYGLGAQQAAKLASLRPERLQTLTLGGSMSLRSAASDESRRALVVPDEAMIALQVPTLGIVGLQDPASRDFIELKRVMPRFVRMVGIENTNHETAIASPDFVIALMYFLRYNPMPK
jgi:Predicted hydrolases or acyltransferases (alpha/beta hydrolase superfamily)